MRIAIVDDRAEDRKELCALLDRYCSQRRLAAKYDCFSSAEALLRASVRYPIVFLDIYMGGMTGMEAARRLREADPDCRLIFFTTSLAHAVESYTVHASYYLTKPVEYERLCQGMDEACRGLARDARQVVVRSGGVAVRVLLSHILYLDCCSEHPLLHLEDRVLKLEDRAAEVLRELTEDERFLCCNRNTAVNLDWVDRALESDFLLKNGQTVPIRQRGRAAVKKSFLQYSLRELQRRDTP